MAVDLKWLQKQYASALQKIPNHPTTQKAEAHIMTLDFTNAIAGEAGELANIGKKLYRKRMGYRMEKYKPITEQHLKEEFADVLGNCLEMAIAKGWSIENILMDKLKEKKREVETYKTLPDVKA